MAVYLLHEPTRKLIMTEHVQHPIDRDRAAISDTVQTIARSADLHQWDAVRAAFAESVELDYGTPAILSPREVIDRWQPLLSAFDATQHVVRDIAIELDGDAARVTSSFQATHHLRGAQGGDVWTLAGRYEHELARTASGWKVTRMRMIPEESSGNARLLDAARARAT